MQNRIIVNNIIDRHFKSTAVNFLNLKQIIKKLNAMSSLPDDEFRKAFTVFKSELIEIIKVLLNNDKGDAKRKLSSKQLVITEPEAMTITVADYLVLTELKKAFKPVSTKSLTDMLTILVSLDVMYINPPAQPKPDDLLAMSQAELANLTAAETKIISVLKQFDSDIQALYQCPLTFIFKGDYRAVTAPSPIDTNLEEHNIFINKVLRSHIPLDAMFILGTYADSKALINQMYAMACSVMQTIKEFKLDEDNNNNLLPEVAAKKQTILNTFNADLAVAVQELGSFKFESHFRKTTDLTCTSHVLSAHNIELSLTTNKKVMRDLIKKSSGVELLKHCTVITSGMNQDDLPKVSKFCKLTLINDNEYLLVNGTLAYKISALFNMLGLVKHIFQNTPAYLYAPSPHLSKSELSLHFAAAIADKSKLEKEMVELQASMSNEIISFENDVAWIKLREQVSELSLSPLQQELTLLDEGNQEAILKLHGTFSNYLRDMRNAELSFSNYIETYQRNLNLAISVKEQYDNYLGDLQLMVEKLAALKGKFAMLEQDNKWLDRSRDPLTDIATTFTFFDAKLKLIEEYFAQCSTPINCNDLQQQSEGINKIKLEFNLFNSKLKEVTSAIEAQKILLGNSDLAVQKKYGANSSRFNYSTSPTQTINTEYKVGERALPTNTRP
jgi:hypothetical protein